MGVDSCCSVALDEHRAEMQRLAGRKKPLARLLDALVAKADSMTIALIVFGMVWFICLPLHERSVKAEEKSLMIGGASSTLRCI